MSIFNNWSVLYASCPSGLTAEGRREETLTSEELPTLLLELDAVSPSEMNAIGPASEGANIQKLVHV
jgi:hypothetical protein